MLREEIKQLKTGPSDLRKFGLTVGGVFALLALLFWARHKPVYICFAWLAAPLISVGLIYPKGLRLVYIGWMSLAFFLGTIVSTVLLTVFFFFVITPIGFIARCAGKDFLGRKLDRQAKSYWIKRDLSVPRQKADFERQF